ncbi:MAG: class I SAM-dependent methyltransferase [Tychonema bourrellyi B0820]|uniref:Class I SAM-dependent methyltransferase n=1 Tax=Tychonema bourrellyi FEM_GT703 TaxID=2040638 RepID=A0A2G4F4H1_9CYAN|nr:class I SAM-dependent methyltransferase [Tychonema bourrellyi]MDQ2097321.1 class I SAM-dependent methyltransferase [Tychonema bourrellyi B0820]PHX56649.1 class I SAM-dependent methyltransferase [Tychonema bourrellyi FEM_GT703]
MTFQQSDINDSNPELCNVICERIAATPQQRITFAEYMDLALYHPQYGYYNRDRPSIGKQGDFITSSHWGADFAEVLAEQFVEMWELLVSGALEEDRPFNFAIVEMGAGRGTFAQNVLQYLERQHPNLFKTLTYIIIEVSPTLESEQRQILGDFDRIKWCNWDEIVDDSIVGCFFSNELVDAFPVHQFILEKEELREIYITTETQKNQQKKINFIEVVGEVSTPKIAEYFELLGVDLSASVYGDGYRSEVNLAALDWMSTVAQKLQRGYLLTIDYGHPAHRYYNPRRREGTLQCYYRHRYHNNPYINVGRQDLTAHVNFTALERQGELCGLDVVGFTQQALFLMALGLGDRIAALSTSILDVATLLRRREELHRAIDPMGLGGFGVLVQSKGLREGEKGRTLKGLIVPD